MLNCEEYQQLDELMQAQLLWVDGVHLMTRYTEKLNVELYGLYGFYTEVFFDKEEDEPLYIKAFERMDYLDIYLEVIRLEDLFQQSGKS